MDERRGIGVDGHLPWYLSADLRRFKSLTMGHHMIMGRKTYDSIGRPLPGRTTIIVSRDLTFQPEGCMVARSIDTAIEFARFDNENEVDMADRIYLTQVHASLEADVYFPEYSPEEWRETESSYVDADENNEYPSTFRILERKR
jgi:dihydrofolate reductase